MSASQQRTGLFDSGSICKPVAAWKAALRLIAAPLGRETRALRIGLQFTLILLALTGSRLAAAEKAFTLSGVSLTLEDVSSEIEVRYRSMRLNRAQNVWNVEALLTNRSSRVVEGPFLLLVEGFSGTTGPQQPDGSDDSTPAKAFFDFSASFGDGALSPGEITPERMLTLGVGTGAPNLVTKIFAAPNRGGVALGLVRSLNEVGQPLTSVHVEEIGPVGPTNSVTDPVFGVATVGQGSGVHLWKFSAPGYLPVWRQQTLTTGEVAIIASPRLTRRGTNSATITLLDGAQVRDAGGAIQINFPAGAVTQNTTATLTPLTGQTLPALLPLGWSPLQAFWLELSGPISMPATTSLRPAGQIGSGETAALARLNENTLQWEVVQLLPGSGTNSITATLNGGGAYALVVGDLALVTPPAPQIGQTLQASPAIVPDLALLTATGRVNPSSSPASRVPELVTASAQVTVSHPSSALPSGLVLRGEVIENYRLSDGTSRHPPQYENFVVGYQRPGDASVATLQAEFPMRPIFLFGSEELEEATVRVDVLTPTPFAGSVFDARGGQVTADGLRVLAGSGDVIGQQAAQLRRLNPTNFTDLVPTNVTIAAAFDLTVSGVASGRRLVAQLTDAPTNSLLVLARVLYDQGQYGLQPLERLNTDGLGKLVIAEPVLGDRLDGIVGAGQYVLLQISARQALVAGIARNSAGQPTAGMPVRITGQPWLAFSKVDGSFELLSPTGSVNVAVTDPATGDTGQSTLVVTDPNATANTSLASAAAGPRVVSINPTNGAVNVSRVTRIEIAFSEPVNPATLLGSAIQLLGTNGQPVAASLTLNLRNTVATMLPTDQLAPSTLHSVVLSTNIADLTGLKLEGQNSFTFTTESDRLNRGRAELVIFAPGSTNIPADVLANIPAFTPGEEKDAVVVEGKPGSAEPDRSVILINETTGETSTVLSKVDGSFYGLIRGTEEDFVSASIQNANGTQTYLPVSRQEFDNGFVGLYRQGGILEATSDGAPVEVTIQPETIKTKTEFRIQGVSLAEIQTLLAGVQPEEAKIAAPGLRVEVQGDRSSGRSDLEIAVDPTKLGLPAGTPPEAGAYCLAMIREIDGQKVFQVVDRMKYKDGKLFTNTFDGWNEAIDQLRRLLPGDTVISFIVLPLLLGADPVTVTGYAAEGPSLPTDSTLAAILFQALSTGAAKPLAGAFVSLSRPGSDDGLAGRVRPGMVFATSGKDGVYALVAPSGTSGGFSEGYVLRGSHPRFEDRPREPVFLQLDFSVGGFIRKDIVFRKTLDFLLPPRMNISHSPLFPAPLQECVVQVNASHGASVPPTINVIVSEVKAAQGVNAQVSDVVISNIVQEVIGNRRRWTGKLISSNVLTATLKITANSGVAGSTNSGNALYPIVFGGLDVPPSNTIPPSDPNDSVGPVVIATFPGEGERVDESGAIRIIFNEPIDSAALANASAGITLSGSGFLPKPGVHLSGDQRELTLFVSGVQPDQPFTLTLSGTAIHDLTGNQLDQKPSTTSPENFTMTFRSGLQRSLNIKGVESGGGVAISGTRLYTLSRGAENVLLVYDISIPNAPVQKSKVVLPGYPRDLAVIPNFSYVLKPGGTIFTNELVAVVGGNLGGTTDEIGNLFFAGQYLRVYNMGDPANPVRLASPVITLRPTAVTKIVWDPPNLVYQELGSDIQHIGSVNLQEFLIGFNATQQEASHFPLFGTKGKDKTGDGDYVDPGEELPFPSKDPAEFFGKREGHVITPVTYRVQDFAVSGGILGVVLRENTVSLPNRRPAYRTISYAGQDVNVNPGTFRYDPGALPKRVTIFDVLPIQVSNVLQTLSVALVSLSPDFDGEARLSVLDISLPENPKELSRILLPPEMVAGLLQSVVLNAAGTLELATTRNIILLDPFLLAEPQPGAGKLHPAIIGFVADAGSGNMTLGTGELGLRAVSLGGRHDIVQTPPPFEFVNFSGLSGIFDPSAPPGTEADLAAALAKMSPAPALIIARIAAQSGVPSDLDPPSAEVHYHVLIHAPGGAGPTIPVGIESLNRAGRPRASLGLNFPPVKAVTSGTLNQLKQTPRDCDATADALTAYRLGADASSPYYNLYLTKPFVVVAEKVQKPDLPSLRLSGKREVIWSGAYLRAFIDPSFNNNQVLGTFAASVDDSMLRIVPSAGAVISAFDATYVMGDNPPPVGGATTMPGSFGSVSAHSGELRTEMTDMIIPGRRMAIEISRSIGGQDVYDGPFGRGWDFNYNQRLEELKPQNVPQGRAMPLVEGSTTNESAIAESKAILFHNGEGRIILFKHKGQTAPTEISQDLLVQELTWLSRASDYYLPEPGTFDIIAKFRDGRYERLSPDGTRYLYAANGRLETAIDRYADNRHMLDYGRDGRLSRITDKSVTDDRFVDFGYYRFAADNEYDATLDKVTDNAFLEGKIYRVKDYAGSDVLFNYDEDGVLTSREGPQTAGENGGFSGRSKTTFNYSGCDIRGVSVSGGGAPLFSAAMNTAQNGETVAASGNGIGGSVTFSIPAENKAKDLDGMVNSATHGGVTTEFTFDKRGYPTKTKLTGGGGSSPTMETKYNEHGQMTFQKLPEGTTITMVYDSSSTIFRSRGNLLSVTYDPGPRGGTPVSESWNYDSKYNLPSGIYTDKNDNSITYTLTSDKKEIEKISYPGVGDHKFTVNSTSGQLLSEETPPGVKISFGYDSASGFLQSETLGTHATVFAYNGTIAGQLGRPTSVTPPDGSAYAAEYDANLQLTKLTRGGFTEARGYNEQGLRFFVEEDMGDGRKRSSTSEFDEKAFLKKLTVKGVEVEGTISDLIYDYTPDEKSRIKEIHHPGGTLQTFEYNGQGNLIKMTLGGYTEEYTRDLHGNATELKIGGDVVENTVFDGFDRPIQITKKADSGDEVQVNTYHKGGELRLTTITDPLYGMVFEKEVSVIDSLGRPKTVKFPGTAINGTYQYGYAAGSFSIAGPRQTTKNTWDKAGHATGFSGFNTTVTQTPTDNGKVDSIQRVEDGATFTTSFTYDSMDNLKTQVDGLGQLFDYESLADGSIKKVTNARGNSWDQTFSSLGELLSRKRADGMEFSFTHSSAREPAYSGDPTAGFEHTYDTSLRLKSKTLRGGGDISFQSFNGRNLPETVQMPGGGTMSIEYDLQGRVTDQTVSFAGTSYVITYKRDALDRIRETTYGSGGGNAPTATVDYDTAGPLTKARFQEDGGDFTVEYGYYSDGARKSVMYPSGILVEEQRDAGGRLTGLQAGGDNVMNVTVWQGNANPKSVTLGTAISAEHNYDARERLLSSRYTGNGGTVLAHLRYQYDLADNLEIRQQLHRAFRADVFEYDNGERVQKANLGALPSITGAAQRPEGTYQPTRGFGPGIYSRSFTYDASKDFLTSIGGLAAAGAFVPPMAFSLGGHDGFLHPKTVNGVDRGDPDALGNVAVAPLQTRSATASAPLQLNANLVHDGLGRLRTVTRDDGIVIENSFQPSGLRYLKRVLNGGTELSRTWFVYDSEGRLIEEYQKDGTATKLTARYFYFDEDAPVAADLLIPATGTLVRCFYLRDQAMSVVAVADAAGNAIERVQYDVFGQPLIQPADRLAPVIDRVVPGVGNDIFVVISESVVPPFADPGAGIGIVIAPASLQNVITFVRLDNGLPIPGTLAFAESQPGFVFGTAFRFTPSATLTGQAAISLQLAALSDEWGNRNLAQTVQADFSQPPINGVYFAAIPTPITAPLMAARSVIGSPFLFQGQYFDYETGLSYMRARFYDPFTGQFLEPDPVGYEDSVNLYAGLGNNPLTMRDPLGTSLAGKGLARLPARDASYLAKEGLDDIVIEAMANVLARRQQSIRMSIRSFGDKASARRIHASKGIPNKPAYEKGKTNKRALGVAEAPSHRESVITSDLDILHIEIDGRMASHNEYLGLIREVNREYNRLFHASPLGHGRRIFLADGQEYKVAPLKPNPPFQHGMHSGMVNEYGKKFLDGKVDNEYLAKVGHPGDSFTIRTVGQGEGRAIIAHQTPRWQTQMDLDAAESILKIRQAAEGHPPTGWPAAIKKLEDGTFVPDPSRNWDKWRNERPLLLGR